MKQLSEERIEARRGHGCRHDHAGSFVMLRSGARENQGSDPSTRSLRVGRHSVRLEAVVFKTP
jgi:hypothetical protein